MHRKVFVLPFILLLLGGFSIPIETPQEEEEETEIALPDFMRLPADWALEQVKSMTLEEKIAQSFMVEVTPRKGEKHLSEIDSLVRNYKIGGVIVFQGTKESATQSIQKLQSASTLPLLVGIDGEWGSSMRLSDGERFPFQMTIGAANDLENTYKIGKAMGQELNELGIHFSFSPVVDLNSNPDNPVIGFRSFGENPLTVSKNAVEMIKGLQETNVLNCMKHFPGHGDTKIDSHIDLPVVSKSFEELNRMEWLPYKQGRLAGASAIMVGHLQVPNLDDSGLPASISPKIIQGYLRNILRFQGLVVSDALNMGALTKRYNDVEIVKRAYVAGNDILLYPTKIKESIEAIQLAIEKGEITEEEVNKRAIRVLRAKYYAIVHPQKEAPKLSKEEIEFAKWQIYEKALVVAENKQVIPIRDASKKSLIVNLGGEGTAFNEMAKTYINADEYHFKNGIKALQQLQGKLKDYQRIFVNIIAPSVLPKNDFSYPNNWKDFLQNIPQEMETFVCVFGNPYGVRWKFDFANSDAIIFAFQNTDYGQNRVAQLLFGSIQSTAVLPITLSIDFQEGQGIKTESPSRLKYTVPMELGLTFSDFEKIDSIAQDGVDKEAYPGCQIVVAKSGKVIYQKSFGKFTYAEDNKIENSTLFDIASITKIASSTYSLMYLEDQGKFSLDSTLGSYLAEYTDSSVYATLKMKDILTHQARLVPWIPFYTQTLVGGKPDTTLYSVVPIGNKTAPVTSHLFLDSNYEKEMIQRIVNTPLLRQSGYKYSDLGYYFMKKIIEKESGESLQDFVLNTFYLPMGMARTRYLPTSHFSLDEIAPTEEDKYFRYQKIQGYVHDMGAAMTGGVGGHAGVFSTANDLAVYMQMLLNGGYYGGKQYLSPEVVKKYTSCQYCPQNRRGAGFDKPVVSGTGGPSSNLVDLSSFGHTGFTGTIAWADPRNEINYVFLSNRTYPDAENWKITKMNIRTKIQDEVYRLLK